MEWGSDNSAVKRRRWATRGRDWVGFGGTKREHGRKEVGVSIERERKHRCGWVLSGPNVQFPQKDREKVKKSKEK